MYLYLLTHGRYLEEKDDPQYMKTSLTRIRLRLESFAVFSNLSSLNIKTGWSRIDLVTV